MIKGIFYGKQLVLRELLLQIFPKDDFPHSDFPNVYYLNGVRFEVIENHMRKNNGLRVGIKLSVVDENGILVIRRLFFNKEGAIDNLQLEQKYRDLLKVVKESQK
jgi:hypothetical protein